MTSEILDFFFFFFLVSVQPGSFSTLYSCFSWPGTLKNRVFFSPHTIFLGGGFLYKEHWTLQHGIKVCDQEIRKTVNLFTHPRNDVAESDFGANTGGQQRKQSLLPACPPVWVSGGPGNFVSLPGHWLRFGMWWNLGPRDSGGSLSTMEDCWKSFLSSESQDLPLFAFKQETDAYQSLSLTSLSQGWLMERGGPWIHSGSILAWVNSSLPLKMQMKYWDVGRPTER